MSQNAPFEIVPERQYASLENPTPFLSGLENELGVTVWGFERSELVERYKDHGYQYTERPPEEKVHVLSTAEMIALKQHLPEGLVGLRDYLSNGARLYVDHHHPEYSTPECRSIRELLLAHTAGELVVRETFENAKQAGILSGYLLNTFLTDGTETNSWGAHENYLVPHAMRPEIPAVYMPLASHMAARQIFTSAYDAHTGHLSQRARHFEMVEGAHTTQARPIVNTRDHPYLHDSRYRRLHVISADATQLPGATALKVGMMNVVNRLIAHGVDVSSLHLRQPLRAFHAIGADMTLQNAVEMTDGSTMTALDIEERFIELALQLDERADVFTAEERAIMQWQERLIGDVRANPTHEPLIGVCDWASKYDLMLHKPERANIVHFNWGWLSPKGIATYSKEKGAVATPFGFSMGAAREYITKAPEGRATKRGRAIMALVQKGHDWASCDIDWTHIDNRNNASRTIPRIDFPDPCGELPTDESLTTWIDALPHLEL